MHTLMPTQSAAMSHMPHLRSALPTGAMSWFHNGLSEISSVSSRISPVELLTASLLPPGDGL